MKLLHTSDWHLGKSLYDFSLLGDQRFFIDALLDLMADEAVDCVLLCGDIYDRPVPSGQAVQLYDYFLSQAVGRMGIPVVAIAGNHDSASRLEFGSSLYQSSGYYIVGSPRKDLTPVELRDCHGPLYLYPIPYLHPADLRAQLEDGEIKTFDDAYRALMDHNRDQIDPAARNVALAHGFFSNLSETQDAKLLTSDSEIHLGGMDIVSAQHLERFDYAALGHLHGPQWVAPGQARYSGAPLKYSLSEERQQKSVTLVQLGEKGSVETEIRQLPARRDVRTLRGTMAELLDPSFHENPAFEDYVFAEIAGEETTFPMEKLRVLFPNLLGLQFLNQNIASAGPVLTGAVKRQASLEELFSRFYRDTQGEALPRDHLAFLQDVILELGREEDAQ